MNRFLLTCALWISITTYFLSWVELIDKIYVNLHSEFLQRFCYLEEEMWFKLTVYKCDFTILAKSKPIKLIGLPMRTSA